MSSKKATPLIVQDTREQTPYKFPAEWLVIKKALPSGDYSVLGHEHIIAVERKSLPDLAGCIFTQRFKNELERLRSYQHAFLVIESSIYKIENLLQKICRHSKAKPASIIGYLQSIPLLYGVHVLYLENRETSERYTAALLEKYTRFLMREKENSEDGC